jgi:hypothetical protein
MRFYKLKFSFLIAYSFVEIIGVIHEVVKTQSVASGKKPCTNLILANEWYYTLLCLPPGAIYLPQVLYGYFKMFWLSIYISGDMVDVTLWEAFSIQLMNYITNRKDKGPIVLILTHAQCKLGGSLILSVVICG